jgi:phosphoribosylamine--glycine ligase
MRILIVGGGGREHALAWALARSPQVERIFALPGNPGLARLGECLPGSATDLDGIVAAARGQRVDLVVVGPEAPLAAGVADRLQAAGVPVFGPSAAAARIESSKVFAREFMARRRIPGAAFATFDALDPALAHLRSRPYPCVVKADGLASGKGAVVCADRAAAEATARAMLEDRVFGDAGRRILVEEFLDGEEVSVLGLTDGERVLPLVPSQDHKPVFDGDAGPNTGGMGAYAPWLGGGSGFTRTVVETILEPVVHGLREEGAVYRGCLYAGLIVTSQGPRVIEFNCRFGDPETQAILPLLDDDLLPPLLACANGRLGTGALRWRAGSAVSVVIASRGYPAASETGIPIAGIEAAEASAGVIVFHAGTALRNGVLVTAGGRVLDVTASGRNLVEARENVYGAAGRIHFDGCHMRRDIGAKGLAHAGASR